MNFQCFLNPKFKFQGQTPFSDNRNRLASITDPLLKKTDFQYDAVGNVEKKTTPNLQDCTQHILYTYNAIGQLWEVFYPKRNRFVYEYDKNGARTKMKDRHTDVDYTYDALNRLVQVTDNKLSKAISYSYDAVGNRTQMIDAEGNVVAYTYDAAKRLDTVKRNAILQADYDYDAAGRRVKLTLGNGSYTEYTYDVANRLTLLENKKSDATVISSFAYQMDNVGNRTRTTYADGDYIDYTYDELYRLTDETRTGATSYSQQFTYDAVGNRTQLVKSGQAGGQTINYTYNAGDQLLQAQDLAGPTTSYAYDDNGNMTQTAIGAQTAYYYHDFDNRLVSINRDNLFFADAGDLADETTRSHRRLAYGSSSARSPAFTKRQFLLRADSPSPFLRATFWVWSSGFGLLLLAIFLCELPLLLYRLKYCRQRFDCVSAWPKRYSFFEKCLICLLLAFSFILLNPETEVAYALPTSQAKYTYAPDGARIEKDVDGAITKFIYDGANAIAEYDNTNPPQMNLLATYVTPSTDFNISKTDTTGAYFYTHDGLGSVRQLLDSSEAIENDYDYNAFGEGISETEVVTNDFKYTGRRFDLESGIYYYRARYYHSAIGRFLQKDPLFVYVVTLPRCVLRDISGLIGLLEGSLSIDLYTYAHNNPPNFVDPSGRVAIALPIAGGLSLGMLLLSFLIALVVVLILYLFSRFIGCFLLYLACLSHAALHATECVQMYGCKKPFYAAAVVEHLHNLCWRWFKDCVREGEFPLEKFPCPSPDEMLLVPA